MFAQKRNFMETIMPVKKPTNENRKAVVIGMSDYSDNKLNNTLNDADDMSKVLSELGFEVTLLKNNDRQNLETHLNTWYETIERNDMAIFYFAGHGMQVNGTNYLLPVDAKIGHVLNPLNALSLSPKKKYETYPRYKLSLLFC